MINIINVNRDTVRQMPRVLEVKQRESVGPYANIKQPTTSSS